MIEIALMIEGQAGLTWPRWQRIARAAEELGFAGLFRSDHFTGREPPDQDSLELWTSLTWLADHTERLAFGPLVTPISFRDPALTARMAKDVDDLSGGRLTLGLGAGWQAREHEMFGYELLDTDERFARFEEGLQVITRLLRSPERVTFEGRYYRLREAVLLPRPARPGGPPLLIGGNGVRRTLPLAARFADEWNGVFLTPEKLRRRNKRLNDLLIEAGRRPEGVRRSMMAGVLFGRDEAELRSLLARRKRSAAQLKAGGWIVGTASEVVDQIGACAQAGAQRLMLQWLDLDDLDRLQAFAASVLPQVQV